MAHPSEPRLLVLHGLRLKGVAGTGALARAMGLPPAGVDAVLQALSADGLVVHRNGVLPGWVLTPAGRVAQEQAVAAEADAAAARDGLARAYERFRELNPAVLEACSRWQVRQVGGRPVRNDHSDPGYDRAVVRELGTLHGRARPVCDRLGDTLDRYRPYGPRLGHALDCIRSGDTDYFTKPLIPSYHTVWFELHEDLLTTLGIDRSAEAAP